VEEALNPKLNPDFAVEWLARIEDAGLNASAPAEQRWMDGWLVRLSAGKAQRARCVNALALGRRGMESKLQEVRALYEQAGLPLLFRITPFTEPSSLDASLAAMGFEIHDPTCVMALKSGALNLLDAARTLPPGHRVETVDATTFAQAVGELRGSPQGHVDAHAQRLAQSPVPYVGHVVRRDREAQVVACAQVAVEGPSVGLYDVATRSDCHGQGLATALCATVLMGAIDGVAEHQSQDELMAYLQVSANNDIARRVYRRLGFVDVYAYHYRRITGQAPPAQT
jgi:ribosomal protein S18 acetylase RimI-like enzyme